MSWFKSTLFILLSFPLFNAAYAVTIKSNPTDLPPAYGLTVGYSTEPTRAICHDPRDQTGVVHGFFINQYIDSDTVFFVDAPTPLTADLKICIAVRFSSEWFMTPPIKNGAECVVKIGSTERFTYENCD
jgi:hypothetical protein